MNIRTFYRNNLNLKLFVFLFMVTYAAAAEESMLNAVVVAKIEDKQALTILNQSTGLRHTYFLNEQTRVMSNGAPVRFEEVQAGQAVVLDFARTDIGRELKLLRIPSLDVDVPPEFQDSDKALYVSGIVTGVRPFKRTLTVRGPKLSQRLTFHIPKSTQLRNGVKLVNMQSIKKGDKVELKYLDTTQGYMILEGQITPKTSKPTSGDKP